MSNAERISSTEKLDDSEITLGILNAVHENERITQRSVAQELGIALGLANAYLKRCARKGLIKVSQAPANRYAYYLTPQGFAEKSRLTAEYLSESFRFFRNARNQCSEVLQYAAHRGWTRVALHGTSELAEVATLCDVPGVEVVAVVDPAHDAATFSNLPVVDSVTALDDIDALLLTALSDAQRVYDALVLEYPAERILVPGLLRVTAKAGDKP